MNENDQYIEDADDLTQKRYNLVCKLKFFKKSVTEQVAGKTLSVDRKMALLIPQESDQRTFFLNAWLPETMGEYFELAGMVGAPVDSPCRFAIQRGPDEKSEKHYLFVMSKGVEDILVKYGKEGQTFKVTTFKAKEDGETDYAVDESDGNFHLIPGHTEMKR